MHRLTVALLFGALASCAPKHSITADDCANRGTSILVRTDARRLHLCEKGATARVFKIQVGRRGVDKRAEGDNKSPLGSYSLGAPRDSKYCLFVPVGYPTEKQRDDGFTGGAIGIHGPPKSSRWLGRLRRPFNWTRGCIAVATEREIVALSSWVEEQRPGTINIER